MARWLLPYNCCYNCNNLVANIVKTCFLCQKSKSASFAPTGIHTLLQTLSMVADEHRTYWGDQLQRDELTYTTLSTANGLAPTEAHI